MEFTKLKLYATSTLLGLAILPKAGYIASDFYITQYKNASNYVTVIKEKSLNKLGLSEIKPDKNLDIIIEEASKDYNLPTQLLKALIRHESHDNPDALSLKSAISYAQIMPANYKRCNLKSKGELWNTEKNIRCGAQILSEELKTSKGDLEKALFAYNGGSNAFKNKYPESVKHSQTVMKIYAQNMLDSH